MLYGVLDPRQIFFGKTLAIYMRFWYNKFAGNGWISGNSGSCPAVSHIGLQILYDMQHRTRAVRQMPHCLLIKKEDI